MGRGCLGRGENHLEVLVLREEIIPEAHVLLLGSDRRFGSHL